jgi:hypothetical protein
MSKSNDASWLDAAIKTELEKDQEASRARFEAAKDRALAELKRSMSAQAPGLSESCRQPTIVELAVNTVDQLHRGIVTLNSKAAQLAGRNTGPGATRPGAVARGDTDSKAGRRAMVDTFLTRCNEKARFKVIRQHIWRSVGHRKSRQFEYWQACSDKATAVDDRNFRRILSMNPTDFIALLGTKGIASDKA